MTRSGLIIFASCLCLVSGLWAGDASGTDLVGEASTTLRWAPASGPVVHYGVYVARNGGPFADEPEIRVAETSATVSGDYGDSLVVRVAGFDALGQRGPFSDHSVLIRFIAPEEPDPRLVCQDFNADGRTDLFWSDGGAGPNEVWLSTATGIAAKPAPDLGDPGFELAAAGDFDGDGHGDLFWRDPASGDAVLWLLRDGELAEEVPFEPMDSSWVIVGVGEHDGDGRSDLVWYRPRDVAVEVWRMRGNGAPQVVSYSPPALNGWNAVAVGDHDGDGRVDVYWRELSTGENSVTLLGKLKDAPKLNLPAAAARWVLAGAADTNGDRRSDIIWHDPVTGTNVLWLGDKNGLREERTDASAPGWYLVGTGDHDGDGRTDLVWRDRATGDTRLWLMNGSTVLDEVYLGRR